MLKFITLCTISILPPALFAIAFSQPKTGNPHPIATRQIQDNSPQQEANQSRLDSNEISEWAVANARREVKMLDDMYKTAIVLITKHYVNNSDDLPAGEAFKLLFETVEEKGWHQVRLLDATGEPINDDNTPRKGFERRAVEKIATGRSEYNEVIEENGKRFLRAATAIPVVMDKCIMCHDNYAGLPKGKAIGAIGYKVPIKDPPKSWATPKPKSPKAKR